MLRRSARPSSLRASCASRAARSTPQSASTAACASHPRGEGLQREQHSVREPFWALYCSRAQGAQVPRRDHATDCLIRTVLGAQPSPARRVVHACELRLAFIHHHVIPCVTSSSRSRMFHTKQALGACSSGCPPQRVSRRCRRPRCARRGPPWRRAPPVAASREARAGGVPPGQRTAAPRVPAPSSRCRARAGWGLARRQASGRSNGLGPAVRMAGLHARRGSRRRRVSGPGFH